MERKKAWKKYLNNVDELGEIKSTYRDLRRAFNREGWTEKDLERPQYYPQDILRNFQKFSDEQSRVYELLKKFFDIVDFNEFADYLKEILHIIDLEIPLKNGNTKRNNRRDEDN